MKLLSRILAAVVCFAICGSAQTGRILFVDDDGAQCPGGLSTIQEAVAKAAAGTTILVCPGTYRKQVSITGAAKNGLQVIAMGRDDEVVLVGDHTQAYGFYLEDVSHVLIRGFSIRDFGDKPTTESQFGWGCAIHLENSNYNTLESNRMSKTDMMGITLSNSAHNVVRYNFIFDIDPQGLGNGIWLQGKKSSENLIFQNYAYRNPGGGIAMWGAGSNNVVLDNDFSNNGQWGITHRNTVGTRIEGNRFSYNAGAWGAITTEKDRRSLGIELRKSDKVVLLDNIAVSNTAFDVSWDNTGEISFTNNTCVTADQPGLCRQ
jgi:parallel beta-helix repeat protein